MHVGLDLGSCGVRSISVSQANLVGRRMSMNFCALPDDDDHRNWLTRAGIPFATCDACLLVFGEQAEMCARMLHVPCQSLLPFGEMTGQDVLERQILAAQLERFLPSERPGAIHTAPICCFSQPSDEESFPAAGDRRNRLLTQILQLRGYVPISVPAGIALGLAEMVREGFSGIALVLGGTHSEMTITLHGNELLSHSLQIGGDWIDEEVARRMNRYCYSPDGERILDVLTIRRWRERLARPLLQPVGETDRLICEVYAEYLTDVICSFAWKIQQSGALPGRAWPLICGGGLSRTNGLRDLLARVLVESEFPIPISEIRLASANEFTIARGCLARAHLEAEFRDQQRAA
ncbi:MAG: hypothetical protein U0903_03370 [Planctomycetales bacterium]